MLSVLAVLGLSLAFLPSMLKMGHSYNLGLGIPRNSVTFLKTGEFGDEFS